MSLRQQNIADDLKRLADKEATVDAPEPTTKEIVSNDDFIRDFVTLDRVQKISDKRFAIEISFATGPL